MEEHQESCPVNRKDEGAIYSPARLSDEVIRMETGLPDKAMALSRVVGLVQRLEGSIIYAAGWRVEGMTMESQVFMALMKVRQNYTHLHLSQLFSCSTATAGEVQLFPRAMRSPTAEPFAIDVDVHCLCRRTIGQSVLALFAILPHLSDLASF
ncbi:unnamed protein product [Gadus morhua 'NCC']